MLMKDELISFFRAWLEDPLATGALLPSSKHLAKEMVSHVSKGDDLIVELGAGTGAITKALLESGIKTGNIIIIEASSEMAKNLKTQFSEIAVFEDNAVNISQILKNEQRKINAIVSSLPLRTLPKLTTESILRQIDDLLPIGGKFIQFTYGINQRQYGSLKHCQLLFSKWIWRNIPPARVDVWLKVSE